MKHAKKMAVYGVFPVLLLLSGCVKIWQENLDIKTYMVEVRRDAAIVDQPMGRKLWIEPVHVLPPYNVRNLVLRQSDVEFSTSYYTELLMSPAENFRNGFYTWFSASHIFSRVSVSERQHMSHRLVVSALDFYGDTVNKKAVLGFNVSLFDQTSSSGKILFYKKYNQSVTIKDDSAEELIRAYNAAFTSILIDCERDVVAALQ